MTRTAGISQIPRMKARLNSIRVAAFSLVSLGGLVHCNTLLGVGDLDFSRSAGGEGTGSNAGDGDLSGDGGTGGDGDVFGMGGDAPVLPEPPVIIGVDPADAEEGVEPDALIVVSFSEALDSSTVNGETLRLTDGETDVLGEVSYNNGRMAFNPDEPLSLLAEYGVSVTTGVEDTSGSPLESPFASTFQTRDGSWGTELEISEEQPSEVQFAADARGNVLLVYSTKNIEDAYDIYVRWHRADGSWDDPLLLESLGENCSSPQVAVAPNGDAIVSFLVSGSVSQVWARRLTGGVWESQERRVEDLMDSANSVYGGPWPMVADGRFLVGWIRRSNTNSPNTSPFMTILEFTSADGVGDWSTTPYIIDQANSALSSQLRNVVSVHSSADGAGALAYGVSTDDTVDPRYSFYSTKTRSWLPGNNFRPTSDVPPLTSLSSSAIPTIVRRASGDAVAVWSSPDPILSSMNVVASYFDLADGWTVPVVVDTSDLGAFAGGNSLSASDDEFFLTWRQGLESTNFNVMLSRYAPEKGEWTAPLLLSDGENTAYYPNAEVVADPHGNYLVTWTQGNYDISPEVHFARYNHLTGLVSTSKRITTIDQPYQYARITGAANGQVFALLTSGWEYGTEDYKEWFAAFR